MARKIHSSVDELEKAFRNHLKGFENNNGCMSRLMLAYAAECGLKMIWLFNNHYRSTEDIERYCPELLGEHGHDLKRWIKELRISRRQIPTDEPEFHLQRGGQAWAGSKAHQAWRYHAAIHSGDEHKLVDWLKQICKWVKKEKPK